MSDDPLQFGKVTLVTTDATRRVTTLQLRGVGDEGSDATSEPLDGVELVQPLGLAANPELSEHTEAAFVRHGDEVVCLVVVDKSRTAQRPEAGEARLHGVGADNAAAVIRIRASGKIEITAESSQDITLNGGTLRVARETDAVDLGAWTFVPGTGGASLSYTPPGGAPTPIGTGTAVAGKIASGAGAAHVKA